LRSIAAAVLAFAFGVSPSVAQPPLAPTPVAAAPTPTVAAATAPEPAAQLTKADVDTWLDGVMPYALSSGGIAGAVVVVVKDGQVLTERGFGYADVAARTPVDPLRTLFRPGSVSKTFTWTAVMQQVEAGKLDLDTDVNHYLDFTIPPYQGQPITLRQLMTHSAGFEEQLREEFVSRPEAMPSLEAFLKRNIPKRIYAPGTVVAYSNYGATLAGYMVQRVSGEPFDAYIKAHIFDPLGMTHSTFDQPLPPSLAPDMSKGYITADKPPHPFEMITVAPAGSLTSSGDDMGRFMIAHLQGAYNGYKLLNHPEVMYAQQHQFEPPLAAFALGFYHEDRNGQVVVSHAGDTNYFHSDMHLILNAHVGFFISMNSPGRQGAAGPLRESLYRDFMDRYFPAAAPPSQPTVASAKADAHLMQGLYWSSRRADSSFLRILNLLGQAKVIAKPDGTLVISDLLDTSHAPEVWREVGPYQWVDSTGGRLVAVVKNGNVDNYMTDELPPVLEFMPVPAWASASWNLPALWLTLAILAGALVLWPLQILVRWRYGQTFPLSGGRALSFRLVRLGAAVQLAALCAYAVMFSMLLGGTLNADPSLDPLLITCKALSIAGLAAVIVEAWNALTVWRTAPSSWWAKLSSVLILLAGVGFAWFALSLHLASPSLAY
ncbi:MAG TPA: serine hydrolase domain-containing protein, partial [Caulobacteraceae bacterium]|nr:serine hydrolase domain-containing protein [Caulobacteraceae bacterium]